MTLEALESAATHEILIVDDTPANLSLLTEIFSAKGYSVRQASSGRLALRSLKVKTPDLILLDINMPEMDGYELCRHLKADERTHAVPVIFLSALDEATDKLKGFDAGGVDYITKPFEPAEVIVRIETHIRLRELTEHLEQKVQEATQELSAANQQLLDAIAAKEVLLREVHHRVKNNLQIVSSLLNLQSDAIVDDQSRKLFQESGNRITAMAIIHELLYETNDFVAVDFGSYLERLQENLFRMYLPDERVSRIVEVEDVSLGIDEAIPCGLIVNELVSNALKYAFPDKRDGEIAVRMHRTADGGIKLEVADNGVGLPECLDFRNTETLGLQLATVLVKQLRGEITLSREPGTHFTIHFRADRQS
jgi:two-component sensor histidine kinase